MQVQRQIKRIDVDIPVTVMTVLETLDASIVDLTELGAQIHGVALEAGTRFQIEYMGETIFAISRWSEIDRMGIKFLFPLTDGPLYERLTIARTSQLYDDGTHGVHMAMAPLHNGQTTLGARTFGRAGMAGNFGRRG